MNIRTGALWLVVALPLALGGCPDCDDDTDTTMDSTDPSAETESPDRDDDGLSDAEEAELGTNPDLADTDGDALLDGWEIRGVNGIDLASKGADPLHKDIFVRMDYMTGTHDCRPDDKSLELVVDAFAAAPVPNPDNETGIALHLEYGNELAFVDLLADPVRAKLTALLTENLPSPHRVVYHYMVWAWRYEGVMGTGSSGFSMQDATQLMNEGPGAPGQVFCVTVGPLRGTFTDDELILAEAGTFMHELGHNLGLRHGGTDGLLRKPNHLSLMNYSFQFTGVLRDSSVAFDYQRFDIPGLVESELNETEGLGQASDLDPYETIYYNGNAPPIVVAANGKIDWNVNGVFDSEQATSTVATDAVATCTADINRDGNLSDLGGTVDEWAILRFDGAMIGSGSPVEHWPDDAAALFVVEQNHASMARAKKVFAVVSEAVGRHR